MSGQFSKVSETRVTTTKLVLPSHADVRSPTLIAAGQLLQWMDITACLSAEKHSKNPSVTASMDDLEFYEPVQVGCLLLITAHVTRAFSTSMEISCNIETEDLKTGVRKKICSTAYFTFLSLDENKQKVVLPQITTETEEEKREYDMALERRNVRLKRKSEIENVALISKTTSESISSSSKSIKSVGDQPEPVLIKNTKSSTTELVFSQHANHHGTLFGGQLLDWMCSAATISASKLRRGYCILKSIDDVYFREPSTEGERILIYSQVNNTFSSSLEVGVRVESYRIGGQSRHINSAFFTFVALNESAEKVDLPAMIASDDDENRRKYEANARRKIRLERRSKRTDQKILSVQWTEENSGQLSLQNLTNLTLMRGINWELISDSDGVTLSTKEDQKNFLVSIRLEGTITASATKVFKFLSNPYKRKEWDPFFDSSKTIKIIDQYNSIMYVKMKRSSESQKPRDIIFLATLRFPSNFSPNFLIALRSVSLADFPVVEGVERNETSCSGFVISPIADHVCKVSFYNQMNFTSVSHYANDLVGVSQTLRQTFLKVRERVAVHCKTVHVQKDEDSIHFSDADICSQS